MINVSYNITDLLDEKKRLANTLRCKQAFLKGVKNYTWSDEETDEMVKLTKTEVTVINKRLNDINAIIRYLEGLI